MILPHYGSDTGCLPDLFVDVAPGFFDYLGHDRGLRETTLVQYRHYLQWPQDYLRRLNRLLLPDLPPMVISGAYQRERRNPRQALGAELCSPLKVFFRYLYCAMVKKSVAAI